MDLNTIVVMASLTLCPSFLIMGICLGVMLAWTFVQKGKRRWHHMVLSGIRGRDIEVAVKPYLADGWDIMAVIPSEVMTAIIDVHLKKFM